MPYEACFSGHAKSTSISVKEILKAKKLEVSNEAFTVVRFRVGTGGDCLQGGLYSEAYCDSDSLSTNAIHLINRIQPGDKLFIDSIWVRNSAGKLFHARPLVYSIRGRPEHAVEPSGNRAHLAPYYAFIFGYPGKEVLNVDDLKRAIRLEVSNDTFTVVEFTLSTSLCIGGAFYRVHCPSDYFSEEAINILNKLRSGSSLYIDMIHIKNKVGKTFSVKPVVYKITGSE
jgi:hypothetical protein